MSKLHVDSVTKTFGEQLLLSDVFLSCTQGEVKGLVGRNGSGKSTLLKIIFGTEKADTKFVRVGEKIIKSVSSRGRLINYLPQDHFLPNGILIKSLISLFLPKHKSIALMENELIQPLLTKKNQDLSGGEKRIVEILLIIHSEAKFVLLDEPFNGVSPVIREYVMDCINKQRSTKGFIITDHDFANLSQLADNILLLSNGVLKEIKEEQELVAMGYIPGIPIN